MDDKTIREFLNDHFVETDAKKGDFQYGGKFYAPRYGCDMIDHMIDHMTYLLIQRQKNVASQIEQELKPALDDFNGTARGLIKSERFEKTGTEIIENVGHIKSVLLRLKN